MRGVKLAFLLSWKVLLALGDLVEMDKVKTAISTTHKFFESSRFPRPVKMSQPKADSENSICNDDSCIRLAKHYRMSINPNVDPCTDFYQYTCGTYVDLNPTKKSHEKMSPFKSLNSENKNYIVNGLENLWHDEPEDPGLALLKQVFWTCMNITQVEEEGNRPLVSLMDSIFGHHLSPADVIIEKVPYPKKYSSFEEMIATLYLDNGLTTLVTPYVYYDEINTSRYLLSFEGASLNLGSQSEEWYTGNDTKNKDLYFDFMKETVALWKYGNSTVNLTNEEVSALQSVLDFETALAEINQLSAGNESYTGCNMRVMMNDSEVIRRPHFNLELFLNQFNPVDEICLMNPTYFTLLSQLLAKTPEEVVHAYLVQTVMTEKIYLLDKLFRELYYTYFSNYYESDCEYHTRENFCLGFILGKMDMNFMYYSLAVSKLFLTYNRFTNASKAYVNEMVDNIFSAFISMIEKNDWMDESTKAEAYLKAQKMIRSIGYPDIVENDLSQFYAPLLKAVPGFRGTIIGDNDNFFTIFGKTKAWHYQEMNSKLGKPGDRSLFSGSPVLTNAWHTFAQNSINVPLAILQFPFFNYNYPKPINYGAIGTIIGHEITHAFDTTGLSFDHKGNYRVWWTENSLDLYNKKATCFAEQYSTFCYPDVKEDLCVMGNLTLDENIADNGGIKMSYLAYKNDKAKDENKTTLPSFNYLTDDQMFFVAYASLWCESVSDHSLEHSIYDDPHSPGRERVLGVLQNFPPFSETFNCKPGSPMNPQNRCSVW